MQATAYCADVRSLKHFLPRMVELSVLSRSPFAILGELLESAGWRTWNEEERKALEPFHDVLGLEMINR